MAVAIKVPPVAESIVEGVLAQWLKKEGELVHEDEPLFELETDKATQAIPAPATGVLHIATQEGQTVSVGAEVGRIDTAAKSSVRPEPVKKPTDQKPATTEIAAVPALPKEAEPPQPKRADREPAANEAPAPGDREKQAEPIMPVTTQPMSPAARRLVQQEGIDVNRVAGTGRGGRVTKEDVIQFLDHQHAAPADLPKEKLPRGVPNWGEPSPTPIEPASQADRGEHRQRMSPLRQRIAQKLITSLQTTATLTTFNEADLSAVIDLRRRFKDRFKEKYDVPLGFMSFFVKASVAGLRAFPLLNGRIDGAEIVTHGACHIGVAVSSERGLIVPVIRYADQKGFAQIEREIGELADKARNGTIGIAELQGGTFTITNGGVFGSLLSTPILYPGQSGILGMHAVQQRPVAVDDQVVIRPMMYLALSYDHRLIDGREAVQFLVRVKECVEDPQRLLLDV
jgi:2-oxoglutarate dehydrogenase E2 component (dihydrolipoamide succinyltransferase)